jgi:hypothetical protein
MTTVTEIKFDSSKFKLVDEGGGVVRLVEIPPKSVTKDFVPNGRERFCLEGVSAITAGERHIEQYTSGGSKTQKLYYPTRDMAGKAAVQLRREEELIRACLLVDPDFEPNWGSYSQKFFPYYNHADGQWDVSSRTRTNVSGGYVSGSYKCQEAIAILNERGIK